MYVWFYNKHHWFEMSLPPPPTPHTPDTDFFLLLLLVIILNIWKSIVQTIGTPSPYVKIRNPNICCDVIYKNVNACCIMFDLWLLCVEKFNSILIRFYQNLEWTSECWQHSIYREYMEIWGIFLDTRIVIYFVRPNNIMDNKAYKTLCVIA